MKSLKLKYFVFAAALLIALTTPLFVGSAKAYTTEQRTVTTYSRAVPDMDSESSWHEHQYYRSSDGPHGYVIERDFDNPEPDVYREYYYDRGGIRLDLPFFKFHFGY